MDERGLDLLIGDLRRIQLRRGVRVVSISPGVVDTPILPDFRASMGDAAIDAATAEAGRLAKPDDIAPVIAFLLSAEARWVSGVDLRVDGGLVGGRLAIAQAAPAT